MHRVAVPHQNALASCYDMHGRLVLLLPAPIMAPSSTQVIADICWMFSRLRSKDLLTMQLPCTLLYMLRLLFHLQKIKMPCLFREQSQNPANLFVVNILDIAVVVNILRVLVIVNIMGVLVEHLKSPSFIDIFYKLFQSSKLLDDEEAISEVADDESERIEPKSSFSEVIEVHSVSTLT